MTMTLLQNIHPVKGIDPIADFGDTVQSTDIVSFINHDSALFLVYKGIGATGTSTLTVEACSDVTPTTTVAVPFFYKKFTGAASSDDVPDAGLTRATASGFTTTAGSSQLYAVEVRAGDLAATGYKYARLKMTEVVNSPVLGGVAILMGNPRNAQDVPASVIV